MDDSKSRKSVRCKLFTVVLGVVLLTSTQFLPSSPSPVGVQSHHTAAPSVKVLIDGSQYPDLIPDQSAIKVFLLAVAEPPNATPEQLKRLRAKIQAANLNEADAAVFIAEVGAFHRQWQVYQSQADYIGSLGRSNPNPGLRQQLTSIHVQISTLADATYQSILSRLSPEGVQNLRAHLAYVKSKIKVIPAPRM